MKRSSGLSRSPMSPRSAPIPVHVPLQRGAGLSRRGPMPTGPSRRQRARAATWEAVKVAAWEQWGHRCAIHGDPLPWDQTHGHHRLMRSQGGADTIANCLPVCSRAHSMIHEAGDLAYEMGWLIRMGGDPEHVPVRRTEKP